MSTLRSVSDVQSSAPVDDVLSPSPGLSKYSLANPSLSELIEAAELLAKRGITSIRGTDSIAPVAYCNDCLAQTPGPQLPTTTVPICTEGCTVKAISISTAVLQFGVAATWNKIKAPKLPLAVTCSVACPQLGGDPAPGVLKSLVAQQQQGVAYTVTLSDGTIRQVPALPIPVVVPPPPPIKTPVKQWSCTVAAGQAVVFTIYSDATSAATGNYICTQIL